MATNRTDHPPVREEIDFAAPANEDAFTPRLAPVRLLTLADGAARVVRDNEPIKRDELWRGEVHDQNAPDSPPIAIYLRVCNAVPLVAELLCGVIARLLNLPAAEVFVVLVDVGSLPGSQLLDPTQRHLCVGTRDVGGTTFSQLMNESSEYAKTMLRAWQHLLPVTVLDEWLANPDRNYGNILYVAQALHIIDHAEAFGGSARQLFPLADLTHDALTNKLAELLLQGSPGDRQGLLNQAKEWLTFTAGRLDIADAVASAGVRRWQSSQEEAELVNFITTRLTITHHLLCTRLGHPQLQLQHST